MFAVVGRPDDVSAIYHNPAGLVLQRGTRLYHSQTWSYIDIGVRLYDSQGVLRPEEEMTPTFNMGVIPFFGVASDLGTERLQVGLGLYAPNAYGARLDADDPIRYHAVDALFIASQASAAVAFKVSERLSLAASVSLVYVYMSKTQFMNLGVLQDPDRRFVSRQESRPFDNELKLDGHDVTWSAQVGLLFQLTDTLRFGAAFTRGAGILLEGDARITQASDGKVEKTTHETTMAIPSSLRAGINWEIADDLEIGVDITYWHYQVFQEQRTRLSRPLLGIESMVAPKNYGNSWNWCVGLLYRVLPELELMVGFQRDYSPIPGATFSIETPTPDLLGFSLGARWEINESWRVGLGFVRNWYELIDIQDSVTEPPSNLKGAGGITSGALDVTYTF